MIKFILSLIAIVAVVAVPLTADAGTKVVNSSAGYSIGSATTEKVGFHGATPVVQRSGSAQAAVSQTGAVVSTAAATDLTTSEALANALKTQGNANQADIAALVTLVNELRAALVAKGLIKGGS